MKNQPTEFTDVVFQSPGHVTTQASNIDELQDGEFLVRTLYTAISAGTELTIYNGTNPKSFEGWDTERRLFRGDVEPDKGEIYPMVKGYMESAEVVESRNLDVAVGTIIASNYGHYGARILKPGDYYVPLPNTLDPLLGTFVAHMGPISLNGILYAADELHHSPLTTLKGSLDNQRILVMGAGIVGLLCGMFAKWAGASDVVIVDGIEERLETARKLGLNAETAAPDLAVTLKDRWTHDNPMDTGADVVIQCTGSDYLLHQSFSCLKEQGSVIDLGFYQQGASNVQFGKEFHHNRLRHICAQIGAIPRGQHGPWTKKRLSEVTIQFLQDHEQLLKDHVITHVVPFAEADDIFRRLSERDPAVLQAILRPEA